MIESESGSSNRWLQSAHLIRGFWQMPARHSFAQAGEYPALPVVLLSQRTG